jgi:hypothetical protein
MLLRRKSFRNQAAEPALAIQKTKSFRGGSRRCPRLARLEGQPREKRGVWRAPLRHSILRSRQNGECVDELVVLACHATQIAPITVDMQPPPGRPSCGEPCFLLVPEWPPLDGLRRCLFCHRGLWGEGCLFH